jgi:cyclase
MTAARAIPVLLLEQGTRLVKTVRFGERTYVGDPRNAVKIFNDRGADELLVLDIDATANGREPNYDMLDEIVSEAFMPVGYGGGVRTVAAAARVVGCGVEKVVIGAGAFEVPGLIEEVSARVGASSTVVCLDVKRSLLGSAGLRIRNGHEKVTEAPVNAARRLEGRGAGELIVQSIDRDGVMKGYDIPLIEEIAAAVKVPVVACGGARTINDLSAAVRAGAAAAAAGSMFVFRPPHRAVLISYPDAADLDRALGRSW